MDFRQRPNAEPVDLLLADALSPRGEWCGPYAPHIVAANVWVQADGSPRYLPLYDEYAPHARKLLGKRPYAGLKRA